jgi:hypothetical protein
MAAPTEDAYCTVSFDDDDTWITTDLEQLLLNDGYLPGTTGLERA